MSFLEDALPFIGAAATGNVPALVTMAAKAVSGAIGINVEPTADKIIAAVQGATPEQQLALTQAENDFKLKMQTAGFQSEKDLMALQVQAMEAVNQTIQVEAKSEKWPVYSWRPFVGFSFGVLAVTGGITTFIAYIGVMFFNVKPEVLSYIPGMLGAEAAVMATMAPVLGIASYFRGKMQASSGS